MIPPLLCKKCGRPSLLLWRSKTPLCRQIRESAFSKPIQARRDSGASRVADTTKSCTASPTWSSGRPAHLPAFARFLPASEVLKAADRYLYLTTTAARPKRHSPMRAHAFRAAQRSFHGFLVENGGIDIRKI